MDIKIYGTGCSKCKALFENTQKALTDLSIVADLSKVEDIIQITNAGVMFTPAISVDGEVKSTGKALSVEEIKKIIA